MRRARQRRGGRLVAAGLLLALAAAGCGGGDEEPSPPAPRPKQPAAEFPRPGGRSLSALRRGLGPGPVLAPSVSMLEPGRNRFGFALFDRGRRQIAEVPAAVYVAGGGSGRAEGPYPARYHSLAVAPEFRSRSTAADPDSAGSVYAATIPFRRPGRYRLLGVARLDDRLVAAEPIEVEVLRDGAPPEVGERPPRITTPTEADVGGALAQIDTRQPPSSMHEFDFAEVIGRRPVILLFATPALCQSRVCGPVVDIAEQVKARHRGDTAFIHMEIFRDNEVERGLRPQVTAFGLRTEPWLFAFDRRGRVVERIEGAFGPAELERAVARAEGR